MTDKHLLGLFLFFLWATTCQALDNQATGTQIACTYSQKKPMTSGEVKLSLQDSIIHRVSFNNYYPGGKGELGYTCNIDLKRNDEAYLWQDNGAGFIITAKDTGDIVELNRTRKGYKLNFARLKSLYKYCGAGAEVPESLFIPFSAKSCQAIIPH